MEFIRDFDSQSALQRWAAIVATLVVLGLLLGLVGAMTTRGLKRGPKAFFEMLAGPLTPQPETLRRVLRAHVDDARPAKVDAGYLELAARLRAQG